MPSTHPQDLLETLIIASNTNTLLAIERKLNEEKVQVRIFC